MLRTIIFFNEYTVLLTAREPLNLGRLKGGRLVPQSDRVYDALLK